MYFTRIVFLLSFLILFQKVAYSQPAIKFDYEKYNFGKVSEYTLEHTFVFTNVGDKDLIIEKLVPS
jgi:hypothetical protein